MEIKKALNSIGKVKAGKPMWADVPIASHERAVRMMAGLGCRLITISGTDTGKAVEVVYHFDCKGVIANLRFTLGREKPSIGSVVKILPGAEFYERELCEMIGVDVKGVEKRRIFLAEDSPVAPLRKSAGLKKDGRKKNG